MYFSEFLIIYRGKAVVFFFGPFVYGCGINRGILAFEKSKVMIFDPGTNINIPHYSATNS